MLPDFTKNYGDLIMARVQSNTSGSDTIDRSAAPYYVFGDTQYGGTPNTCPSVRWRQGEFDYQPFRSVGGKADIGTVGSMLVKFDIRVVGKTRQEAFNEAVQVEQAVKQDFCYPPITVIKGLWESTEQNERNKKEGIVLSFIVPLELTKASDSTLVTLLSASLSSSISSGSSGLGIHLLLSSSLTKGIFQNR